MSNNPKHTPTPWQIHSDFYETDIIGNIDDATDGIPYALVAMMDVTNDNWKANAAFIVKCVNLHDELVHVVEQFVNGAFTNAITSDHDETFERLLAKAHHTLSKAKESR